MTKEEAVYLLNNLRAFAEEDDDPAIDMAIKALQQERPKGEWKHGKELSRVFIGGVLRRINYEDWYCNNCHCVVEQSIKPKWSFCPNCGAKMDREEQKHE